MEQKIKRGFGLQVWDRENNFFEFGGKASTLNSAVASQQPSNNPLTYTRVVKSGVHGATFEPVESSIYDGSKPLIEQHVVQGAPKPDRGFPFVDPGSAHYGFATLKQPMSSLTPGFKKAHPDSSKTLTDDDSLSSFDMFAFGAALSQAEHPEDIARGDAFLYGESNNEGLNSGSIEGSQICTPESDDVMAGVTEDVHDVEERNEAEHGTKALPGDNLAETDDIDIDAVSAPKALPCDTGAVDSLAHILAELRSLNEEKKVWLEEEKELRSRLDKAEGPYKTLMEEKADLESQMSDLKSKYEQVRDELGSVYLLLVQGEESGVENETDT